MLERDPAAGPLDQAVGLAEVRGSKRTGEDPELDDLGAEQDRGDAQEQRVDLPRPPEDRHGPRREGDRAEHAEHERISPGTKYSQLGL